jgi:hypothetical protein
MTWEEDMLVEKTRDGRHPHAFSEADSRRKRSLRIRYFLTVFGATHFAERIDGRRLAIPRRGHIAL